MAADRAQVDFRLAQVLAFPHCFEGELIKSRVHGFCPASIFKHPFRLVPFRLCLLEHRRIHLRIFVSFSLDRRLQVLGGGADTIGRPEVSCSMNALGLRGCAEKEGNVPKSFLLGFHRKSQILLARLALARKCFLEILGGLTHIRQANQKGPQVERNF